MGGPAQMMQWQKDHAVFISAAAQMKPEELVGTVVIGELHKSEAPEYTAEYDKLIGRLQEKGGQPS
jgi:2-oxoglutarate ferredoxin oxidoreductase subunit beta